MINKIVIKLLLVAFCFAAILHKSNAEIVKTQKHIVCSTVKEVYEAMKDAKQEEVWTGYSPKEKTLYTFFYNKETKEWFIFQYTEEIACLIGYGMGTIKDEQQREKMVDINGR